MPSMADYFLVVRSKGPAWDHSKSRREQDGWAAHAAFMDQLTDEAFVVLGGPVGDGDGDDALLVVAAEDEPAVHERLAADPGDGAVLFTRGGQPWTIVMRAPGRA